MLKDELNNLFKGKSISKQQKKYSAIEYKEVKEANDKIRQELKEAKKAKDTGKLAELTKELDINLERELRLESTNKVEVKFRNTTLELDKSKLQNLSNPDKFVNKLYFNRTFKQVDKLIKQGKETEAKGLLKIAARSKDSLTTDKKKLTEIEDKIEEYIDDNYWDEEDVYPDGDDEAYAAIFSSGGSSISVTAI